MASKAWKGHEKSVAEFFGGKRLLRTNYALSQPDVIVSLANICPDLVAIPLGDWLIECKYSINQPWHRLIVNEMDELAGWNTAKTVPLVVTENLLCWKMTDSSYIIKQLALAKGFELFNNITIGSLDKYVPKYINEMLDQAEGYTTNTEWGRTPFMSMVCIAQKSSKTRICIVRNETLFKYFSEHFDRQNRIVLEQVGKQPATSNNTQNT